MAKRRRTTGNGVQSVGVAATVLDALAAGGGALALRELAQATGMARAKVHRYLAALRAAELVTQEADGGRYRIGPAAIRIGLAGLRILDPAREAAAALPRLRRSVNETVTAAAWGDAGPTIIATERKSGATAPSERELAAMLAAIRRSGVSFRRSALIPGVDAVAAPVFDHKRRLAAVLCAVSRSENAARQEYLAKETATAARGLSRRLGFTGAAS